MSSKTPTPRKSLIEPGSILSTPSSSILDNVIGRDREKSGRTAPAGERIAATEEEIFAVGEKDSRADAGTISTEAASPSGTMDVIAQNTELSNDLSKQVSKSVNHASNTQTTKSLSRRGDGSSATQVGRPEKEGEAEQGQSARRRLLYHATKEPVTRLSIDVPMPMYSRIKQYVAVHNVESIRALTLALYEDFLAEEGF